MTKPFYIFFQHAKEAAKPTSSTVLPKTETEKVAVGYQRHPQISSFAGKLCGPQHGGTWLGSRYVRLRDDIREDQMHVQSRIL